MLLPPYIHGKKREKREMLKQRLQLLCSEVIIPRIYDRSMGFLWTNYEFHEQIVNLLYSIGNKRQLVLMIRSKRLDFRSGSGRACQE